MSLIVASGLVLLHGLLLVEAEGGDEEETGVVVRPEDLRDGQQFLLTFLPDLGRGEEVEDEAAEEEDGETPDSVLGSVSPVVGRGESRALIEQMLREGGAVGAGVLQSEVTEGAEGGHTDGRDQSYRDREARVLDVTATREGREGVGDER